MLTVNLWTFYLQTQFHRFFRRSIHRILSFMLFSNSHMCVEAFKNFWQRIDSRSIGLLLLLPFLGWVFGYKQILQVYRIGLLNYSQETHTMQKIRWNVLLRNNERRIERFKVTVMFKFIVGTTKLDTFDCLSKNLALSI